MASVLLIGAAMGWTSGPAQASDLTPAELQALSPMCQGFYGKNGSRKERLQPFAFELEGSCGVQHTCAGELAMVRYRSAGLTKPLSSNKKALAKHERQIKGMLQRAVGEYSYEIRCAKPGYSLLPMIHTERGKALSLQGNHSSAMKDFARALELDPNYGPARHGLAAAQARAAAPR